RNAGDERLRSDQQNTSARRRAWRKNCCYGINRLCWIRRSPARAGRWIRNAHSEAIRCRRVNQRRDFSYRTTQRLSMSLMMKNYLPDFVKKRFNVSLEDLPEVEHRIVQHLGERRHISRDINLEFEKKLTLGQRLADRVAAFGGSWTFIIIFGAILLFWVLLNTLILARYSASFDPYPYILLNLFLSMLAAAQAPVILMSQNRQGVRDRLDAAHDYEVNLKAELEILSLHEKLDELREMKWSELITMQQEQLRLLTQLVKEHLSADGNHPATSSHAE